MNNAHIISIKKNRYKRLVRRCADAPGDKNKIDRKAKLLQELRAAGVSI